VVIASRETVKGLRLVRERHGRYPFTLKLLEDYYCLYLVSEVFMLKKKKHGGVWSCVLLGFYPGLQEQNVGTGPLASLLMVVPPG
jgi:hypothetical protein